MILSLSVKASSFYPYNLEMQRWKTLMQCSGFLQILIKNERFTDSYFLRTLNQKINQCALTAKKLLAKFLGCSFSITLYRYTYTLSRYICPACMCLYFNVLQRSHSEMHGMNPSPLQNRGELSLLGVTIKILGQRKNYCNITAVWFQYKIIRITTLICIKWFNVL